MLYEKKHPKQRDKDKQCEGKGIHSPQIVSRTLTNHKKETEGVKIFSITHGPAGWGAILKPPSESPPQDVQLAILNIDMTTLTREVL